MTFSAPSQQSESVKVADLNGQLLIIEPIEYKVGIETVHGPSDAIEVNIVNLDNNNAIHNNVLFFNVALKNALKTKIGQKVLARIGQGTAKPGKSAPWILLDATADATAVAKANAYIAGAPAQATPVAAQTVADVSNLPPDVQALLAQLGATKP
jgi:hypothetical protein